MATPGLNIYIALFDKNNFFLKYTQTKYQVK